MVACVRGAEGEFTLVRALCVDDAVVVVEDFVDGDGYGEVWVAVVGICCWGVLEGCVVA